MSKSILIVDDEEGFCITLGDRLRREGYQVECASDGPEAIKKIRHSHFDLIILNVTLPRVSGLEFCMFVRREGITPILFVSARSQRVNKIIGLKLGGDDYIAKPFDTMELLARVDTLLRLPHTEHVRRIPDYLHLESITLDLRKRQIVRNGRIIHMTWKEFQLLRYLAERPGVTISRKELLLNVWGHKPGTLTRTVDIHIASLRKKSEDDPRNPQLIETIPNFGYRFIGHPDYPTETLIND